MFVVVDQGSDRKETTESDAPSRLHPLLFGAVRLCAIQSPLSVGSRLRLVRPLSWSLLPFWVHYDSAVLEYNHASITKCR